MADEDDQGQQEEQDPSPTRAPWIIKSVSRETLDLVLEAAARRGEPVAVWLDRAARALSTLPSPPALDATAVASLLHTCVALTASAKLPADKGLVKEYAALLRDPMRRMREVPHGSRQAGQGRVFPLTWG